MEFIHKQVYSLPEFEFFKYELEWDVDSWEDVINILQDFTLEELIDVLGFPAEYYEVK